MGYGYWLIEEKATGAYVGDGGFGDFKRDLGAYVFDAPEQGWALNPAMHGKGYATEAAAAMIRWAEPHFGRSDFVCMIAPENAPSAARRRKARLPRVRAHGLQRRAVDPVPPRLEERRQRQAHARALRQHLAVRSGPLRRRGLRPQVDEAIEFALRFQVRADIPLQH